MQQRSGTIGNLHRLPGPLHSRQTCRLSSNWAYTAHG